MLKLLMATWRFNIIFSSVFMFEIFIITIFFQLRENTLIHCYELCVDLVLIPTQDSCVDPKPPVPQTFKDRLFTEVIKLK